MTYITGDKDLLTQKLIMNLYPLSKNSTFYGNPYFNVLARQKLWKNSTSKPLSALYVYIEEPTLN